MTKRYGSFNSRLRCFSRVFQPFSGIRLFQSSTGVEALMNGSLNQFINVFTRFLTSLPTHSTMFAICANDLGNIWFKKCLSMIYALFAGAKAI